MSDRPTPETDQAQFGTGRVSVDFTLRLERERDEARELAWELQDALTPFAGLNPASPRVKAKWPDFVQRASAALAKAKEVLG